MKTFWTQKSHAYTELKTEGWEKRILVNKYILPGRENGTWTVENRTGKESWSNKTPESRSNNTESVFWQLKFGFITKICHLTTTVQKIRASVRLQSYNAIERLLNSKIKEIHTIIKAAYPLTQNSGLRLHDFRCFSYQHEEDSPVKEIRQPEITPKDFLYSLCCIT